VKSPSGAPLSASTPQTADQPGQHSYKRRSPFGNRTSTKTLPYAATASAQMWRHARLLDPLEITGAKIDIACPQHARFVGVSRPGPASKRQLQLKRLGDQRLRTGPNHWRAEKRLTYVQDRPRFSDALGLGDNTQGIGRPLSTGCRSKGLASDDC
jgi:hypothetical protein